VSRRWRWARRLLAAAFFTAVGVLLVSQARRIEWAEVGDAMLDADPLMLAAALALTILSYLLYASYDLLGRHYSGHRLPTARVVTIAMVSYAFNLNMGALVGGAGFRFRLYSRFGLDAGTITRVLSISVISNWSGYVLLAGLLLVLQWVALPLQWRLGGGMLQAGGAVLLLIAVAYPLLCRFSPRRRWSVRGHTLELPSWRLALLQLGLSSLNWLTIATIVHLLLPAGPDYTIVVSSLLAAAVAGAITHVPAGVGVLEAIFILALGGQLGTPAIIAALLTYRALYYLLPLAVAVAVYLLLERRASCGGSKPAAQR
jgi:glycosyltransferase 2 family protein